MPELLVPARLEHLAAVNDFLAENVPSSFQPLLPNLELVAEAADTGLVRRTSLDADEGGLGLVEQLQMAIGGAAEGLAVDGIITGKEAGEYAQLIARVCR